MKTKQEMIDEVIENIIENESESKGLLYDLARQGLESKSTKDIKNTYFANEE